MHQRLGETTPRRFADDELLEEFSNWLLTSLPIHRAPNVVPTYSLS